MVLLLHSVNTVLLICIGFEPNSQKKLSFSRSANNLFSRNFNRPSHKSQATKRRDTNTARIFTSSGKKVARDGRFSGVWTGMAYLMVKACKLESCPMKARGSAKFPILSPGKSQSDEKWRLQLRHLSFNTAISLEWLGS